MEDSVPGNELITKHRLEREKESRELDGEGSVESFRKVSTRNPLISPGVKPRDVYKPIGPTSIICPANT